LLRQGHYAVRSSGVYNSEPYSNFYKLSDFTIYHEFEAPDLTLATETFALSDPLLILYTQEQTSESGSVDTGRLTVEFQVAVNFEPAGFVTLLGYLELLRVIVNPRDKSFWLPTGLAPRHREIGPVINGDKIKSTLKDRLLVQSLICDFTLIGAE